MSVTAFIGAGIFDGETLHADSALLLQGDAVMGICRVDELSGAEQRLKLLGGVITPGFIDLQVNGGAGVMLGDASGLDDIRAICQAHRRLGTSGVLLTLISDSPANSKRILELAQQAGRAQVPGFLGLHLEGPHLALCYKGAHPEQHIRAMSAQDCQWLCQAAATLPSLMITLAPEVSSPEQIQSLARSGVVVSLGHSAASAETTRAALSAGAKSITHLFNAMRPLHHREVGIIGAALMDPDVYVGLIADGVHVAPEALQLALYAKRGRNKLFVVSDAMATAASELQQFHLHGRLVQRAQHSLQLADGTLAGAARSLPDCLAYLREVVGVPMAQALAMLTSNPAKLIRRGDDIDIAAIVAGTSIDSVLYLDDSYRPTWLSDVVGSGSRSG